MSNLLKTAPAAHRGTNMFAYTELFPNYRGRHVARRRDVRVLLTRDHKSLAFCPNNLTSSSCQDWQCPRHSSTDYAAAMARHAVPNACGHVSRDMPYMYGSDGLICGDCWF